MGKDMFHSEESVMTYLASLKPIQDPPEDEYDQLSVLEEEGAVVVDEEEEEEKKEMSLLDIDLNLKWRDIWCCLSDCGWRWVPGDENSIYYYVKPQYQEANARLGIDKFASEDDVVTRIARQQANFHLVDRATFVMVEEKVAWGYNPRAWVGRSMGFLEKATRLDLGTRRPLAQLFLCPPQ